MERTIQIDMFEVQLGAALLLQFRSSHGKIVRVLADAGVKASDYPVDHVHKKLQKAFEEFGDNSKRLDLIIGTHYDADHLDGLVPIIQDAAIEIGEVWLPPVANDSERHAFDEPIAEHHLLARQFYEDRDRRVLCDYLRMKERVCLQLTVRGERINNEPTSSAFRLTGEIALEPTLDEARQIFVQYRQEALQVLGMAGHNHADDNRFAPRDPRDLLKLIDRDRTRTRFFRWLDHYFLFGREDNEVLERIMKSITADSLADYNLAWIRKSTADDAINAISLTKVVEALRIRKEPVPIACRIVANGVPRRFVWRNSSQRFEGSGKLAAQGPEIMLLGPSEGLVEKHRHRLPVGSYAALAYLAFMRVKSITPSNQLSYVVRFTAKKQNILITGDAGCVDFKPDKSTTYYRELLATLRPLHVVQVAHHAGNNAHFYRVLLAAGYGTQSNRSYLLVSHATEDRHRPTREFNDFLYELRNDDERVQILFTSQPSEDKVREYRSMIHPAANEPAQFGDVQLLFDRRRWHVKKHAININTGTRPQPNFRSFGGSSKPKTRSHL